MRRYYSSDSGPMAAMDDDDFAWLHQALTEAFSGMGNPRASLVIRPQSLDGEIYTRLRSMLPSSNLRENSPLRRLFSSRRRFADLRFDQLRQSDKERVAAMFNAIKQRRLDDDKDTDTRLKDLEALLAGMRANINQMADAAKRSEEVRDKIEELDEFLANA